MTERRVQRDATFTRNASYAVAASLLVLLVNLALVAILPQALTVESYGFLQLYLLYASFAGLAHLGIVDGVYLDLGGQRLAAVNRSMLTSLAVLLGVSQVVLAGVVWTASAAWTSTPQELGVWRAVAVCIVITNLRFFFIYVLQATASAAQAAICVIVDRGSYLALIVLLVLFGELGVLDELSLFTAVLCDLMAKVLSLCCGVFLCRHIFTRSLAAVRDVARQVPRLVRSGSALLLANLAGMAIIGVARLGVERTWSVREFAFVSLALGVALVGVGLLSSIGMALFPFLRRVPEDELPRYFSLARSTLSPLLVVSLVAYLPLTWLIGWWLPEYADSRAYVGLILPLVIFDGVFVLLTGQMLRTLRLQRVLLAVNVLAGVLSLGFTVIGCLVIHRIEAVLLGLVLVLAARGVGTDLVLRRHLQVAASRGVVVEVAVTVVFVVEVTVGGLLGWLPVVSTLLAVGYAAYCLPRARRAWRERTVRVSQPVSG